MSTADEDVFKTLVSAVFILVALQLLFPSNGVLPLDRRTASLFGAAACTCLLSLFPEVAEVSVGSLVDFDVLLVLTAIMIINFMLLRQPWLRSAVQAMQAVIKRDVDRGFYLVSVIAFLASPLILNDGLCLMLVHPVLDAFVDDDKDSERERDREREGEGETASHTHTRSQSHKSSYASLLHREQRRSDAYYYCLAIACSANIGSVMTFSGNPQNLIVAQYLAAYMNCAAFFAIMLVPATLSWLATIALLDYLRRQARGRVFEAMSLSLNSNSNSSSKDDRMVVSTINAMHSSALHSLDEEEQRENNNNDNNNKNNNNEEERDNSLSATHSDALDPMSFPHIVFSLFAALIVLEFVGVFPLGGLFAVLSVAMLGCTIIANYYYHAFRFCTAPPVSEYSPVNSVSFHTHTHSHGHAHTHTLRFRGDRVPPSLYIRKISHAVEELFTQLDYNLLFIFIGLFIVSGSFLQTHIPKEVWTAFAGAKPFQDATSVCVLSIYIIVASQLVGNVPVVYMAKEEVVLLSRDAQVFGWLLLAWVSTVAGNFTLVGSAANIIVAEKAARHKEFPVEIHAIPHFRICGFITLACIAVGVFVLYLESFLF